MEELLELIKFQGQLILQGPPGTGKTYTAKQLAEKLVLESPSDLLFKEEKLFEFWKKFVEEVDGEVLKTKTGLEFKVRRNEKDNLTVEKDEKTITRVFIREVSNILKQTEGKVENYSIDSSKQAPSYTWGVAKAFRDWILKKYIKIVQFHPSYTYEDFVRGVKIEVDEETKTPKYEVVNKIFAELCEESANNPDINYVLIIDEINRANLPAVLGELIYALEYREEEEVETPYKVGDKGTLKVPSNLYIIGTMNTADRSIGHIDYAIRRRFVFKEILPDKSVINPRAKKLYEEVIEKLFQPENVSAEFKSYINDVKIGHTYFLVKDSEKKKLQTSEGEDIETKILAYKFLYQVVPLIKEYIKDGILIEEKVEAVFQKAFNKHLNSLSLEDVINYIKQ